jgi:hypothetical protein
MDQLSNLSPRGVLSLHLQSLQTGEGTMIHGVSRRDSSPVEATVDHTDSGWVIVMTWPTQSFKVRRAFTLLSYAVDFLAIEGRGWA